MRKSLYCLLGILFLVGCRKENDEFTLFHEDGRAKPIVEITPVIDSSNYELSWSLSEELTDLIVNITAQKGSLYIPKGKTSHDHIKIGRAHV